MSKKTYCIGYKVEGRIARYHAYVEAESMEEVWKLVQESFDDANFGELEDIGDCDTRQINVSNEQGDVL